MSELIAQFGGKPTVQLDGDFDNRIGGKCDEQLLKYVELLFGKKVRGKIALAGGSRGVTCDLILSEQTFIVHGPEERMRSEFERRALGAQDGKVRIEGFNSDRVDEIGALVSVIHSGILVLYQQGDDRVFGPGFDISRQLLGRMVADELTVSDYLPIRKMISWTVSGDPKVLGCQNTGDLADLRRLHDPDFDAGDGLLIDFPRRCVSESNGCLVVTLPYLKSLRGIVSFPML